MLVTHSIKDKVARSLWKMLKETETALYYPSFADWDNFIYVFCSALEVPREMIPPESTAYQCAKAILGPLVSIVLSSASVRRSSHHVLCAAVEERDLTTGDATKRFLVSCENFGRFVDVFGPLSHDILFTVRKALRSSNDSLI